MGILVTYEAVWMKANGLGETIIGVLTGGATLLAFIFGLLWARMADRAGKAEGFVRAGFLAFAAILALLPFCRSLADFTLYALARSLAFPLFSALLPHLAVKAFEKSGPPGSQFANYRMWGSFGFIAATLLAPLVAPSVAWIFWTATIVLIVGTFFMARVERKPPPARERAVADPPLFTAPLVLFLGATVAYTTAVPAIFPFLSVYADGMGASAQFIGLLSASNGLLAAAALPLAGRWMDRFGARYLILTAMIAMPVRAFLYSFAEEPAHLLVPQLLHVFTFACFEVAGILLVSRLVGPERGAMGQALFLGARTIGILVGSLATGYLFEAAGPSATYRIVAALCALALPVYLPLLKLMGPRGAIAAQTDLRSR